jgi:hypothetical protein
MLASLGSIVSHGYKSIIAYVHTISTGISASSGIPTSVTGCILWLDPSDASRVRFNGSTVVELTDKSGNNNHAYMRTIDENPVLTTFNSLNVLDAANGKCLYNTNMTIPTSYSFFAVGKGGSGNSTQYLFKGHQNSDGFLYVGSLSSAWTEFNGNVGSWNDVTAYSSSTVPVANYSMFSATIASGATGNKGYFNGTNFFNKTGTCSTAATGYLLGRTNPPHAAQYWNGQICEVIMYNSSLNNTNRQLIEGYLAHKWGIQSGLPTGHPYKNSAPV